MHFNIDSIGPAISGLGRSPERWTSSPSGCSTTRDTKRFGTFSLRNYDESSALDVLGDRLVVSTYNGNVQVLEPGGGDWKIAARLEDDRFFHRMIPDDSRLLLGGGASMRSGKRLHFEASELSGLK